MTPRPAPARELPLAGIRAIELSHMVMGPTCGLVLADLGAEVIKVEPEGRGDPTRRLTSSGAGFFAAFGRNKKSVTLDLDSPEGRGAILGLVATADVFLENFRPGALEAKGLGYAALSKVNPRLVYCSLSGYGADGPLADRPGHDVNYLALAAGLAAGPLDGETLIRVPWVDLAAGTNAAFLILAALMQARETGLGRHLEVAMLDAAAIWAGAKPPRPGGEGAYGVFVAADGGRVAVAVLEAEQWVRLCHAFGWEDWLADPAFADHDGRRARHAEVTARLREAIAARTVEALVDLAVEYDVGISAVNDAAAAAADPQLAARDLFGDGEAWRPLGPAAPMVPFAPAVTGGGEG